MTIAVEETMKADTPEARRYNRVRRRLSIADFLLSMALLVALLAFGWSADLRDLSYRLAAQNYTLAVFFYVFLLTTAAKVLGIPLDLYSYRLEHRFHLSNQKMSGWVRDQVKGWAVGLALGALLVELLYFTLRYWPQWWWVMAWVGFILLSVVLAQLAPIVLFPIFYKFRPLEDEELRARLTRLSERAGTRVRGVYEWKLSEKTKKANAALMGLGNTRRIVVADTLLENYTHDEIEAVLAHELGHHVHRHIFKGILLQVVVTLFGFWAADAALRYAVYDRQMFAGLSDFANLPLLALVSTALSLVLMPALNAYSRYNERQADRYSWQSIASVAPFVSSMNKLADQNLAERTPSRLVEFFFHSHPPIAKRIAAAQAWAKAKA